MFYVLFFFITPQICFAGNCTVIWDVWLQRHWFEGTITIKTQQAVTVLFVCLLCGDGMPSSCSIHCVQNITTPRPVPGGEEKLQGPVLKQTSSEDQESKSGEYNFFIFLLGPKQRVNPCSVGIIPIARVSKNFPRPVLYLVTLDPKCNLIPNINQPLHSPHQAQKPNLNWKLWTDK